MTYSENAAEGRFTLRALHFISVRGVSGQVSAEVQSEGGFIKHEGRTPFEGPAHAHPCHIQHSVHRSYTAGGGPAQDLFSQTWHGYFLLFSRIRIFLLTAPRTKE